MVTGTGEREIGDVSGRLLDSQGELACTAVCQCAQTVSFSSKPPITLYTCSYSLVKNRLPELEESSRKSQSQCSYPCFRTTYS